MSSDKLRITGRQIAAARDLLDVTQNELAEAVGILPPSLTRIEASKKPQKRPSRTLSRIVAELERRGIEFINGTGVQLKTPSTDR